MATNSGNAESEFGLLLKAWRKARGLSQLELSLRAGVSARHIGFLERGRARPSREMVAIIAAAMDIPAREANLLHTAAGFAPAVNPRPLSDPEMRPIRDALELNLRQQMPFPAWVLDCEWKSLMMNDAQRGLLKDIERELGGFPQEDLLFHPDGLRRCMPNWNDVATLALRRLRREIAAGHTRFQTMFDRVSAYPGIPESWQHEFPNAQESPMVPVHFALNGTTLVFITTLATFGTATDITGQEIRIENYFPADSHTETHCHNRWGAKAPRPPLVDKSPRSVS